MRKTVVLAGILFVLLAFSAFAAFQYGDVNSAHNYSDAISFISDEGIVQGYDDGTYKPYQTLNRAELLKIIVEAAYEKDFEGYGESSCFSDVPAGKWFTKYVCFAKSEGIVEGYSDGRFKPAQEINFVEALKITLQGFDYDYAVSDPWYKSIVDEASEHNFIPLSVSYFDQSFNRGQMADLIARVLKFKDGLLDKYLGDKAMIVATYEEMKDNTANRLVLDGGDACFFNDGASCSDKQICIRETCVDKNRLLPSNGELSEKNCKYDEVYIDDKCEKAKVNFYVHSEEKDKGDMLNDFVDKSLAGFVAASEMSNCPDKIRVIRNFDLCLPKDQTDQGKDDIGEYIFNNLGGPIHHFRIATDWDKLSGKCSEFLGAQDEYAGALLYNTNYNTFTHELAHVYGLWDQYCYFPSDKNPNIVDFEEGSCKEPEDDWYGWYCGREDLGQTPETAYQCLGDFNPYGARTIMGHGDASIMSGMFGYSAKELSYLKEKLNCY